MENHQRQPKEMSQYQKDSDPDWMYHKPAPDKWEQTLNKWESKRMADKYVVGTKQVFGQVIGRLLIGWTIGVVRCTLPKQVGTGWVVRRTLGKMVRQLI